ncbi:MAG: hypothetical protein QF902_04045, partial [Rhodospirillales bacterium]|nr:hypothetical protein [Rhodospirillales bacterium]
MARGDIGKDARATPRHKMTRLSVGQIAFPGSLRRSPDGPASRFAPRLPEMPIRHHQIDSIWSDSALGSGPINFLFSIFADDDDPVQG